ncbi:MAG: DEAD/DEAH box helicase [Bacteroidales bacterium]|nr:DEAD/DEAH box helicase [Bacteroidales bacterium]
MTDDYILAGILKPAKPIGFTIIPYLCRTNKAGYLTVFEMLTNRSIDGYGEPDAIALEWIELSASVTASALARRFSKKEFPPVDFLEKLDKKVLDMMVRPFIEKTLLRTIELLGMKQLALFEAKHMPNLYPEDRITIYQQTANARLRFRRSETGTIYTFEAYLDNQKVNLQHSSNTIVSLEPCYYLSQKTLFAFDSSINGKLLIPFLKKESIEIPVRMEAQYFGTFIKKIVNRCDIEAEGFSINDISVEPNAFLVLENDWQGKPILLLMFGYGEKRVAANHPQKTITELHSDSHGLVFNRLKRDEVWENKQRNYLRSLGLQEFEATYRLVKNGQDSTLYDLVDWIIASREELEENGFLIMQNSNNRYNFTSAHLNFTLKTRVDWFDVKADVTIGDFTLPFYKLRDHILHLRKEYLLPDGTIFIIPDEWFARYRELVLFARHHDGKLSLQKHHYRLLQGFDFPEITELISQENNHEPLQLPRLANVSLRPYQIFGFGWMKRLSRKGFGSLLADDMGLGKTIQLITLLTSYYSQETKLKVSLVDTKDATSVLPGLQLDLFAQPEPVQEKVVFGSVAHKTEARLPSSLVVMPASLIHNWIYELQRVSPGLKVYAHTGVGRSLTPSVFKQNHIILTTYGTLRNDIVFLENYSFAYIVLDESQNIKNPASKTAMATFRLQAAHRVALSGTPVENSLTDLWSQMNFLNPGVMGSLGDFNMYFANLLLNNPKHLAGDELLNIIKPFLLRRTKEEVATELPPVTETVSFCTMETEQQRMYDSEKSKIRNHILSGVENGSIAKSSVMVLRALMQLRQIANHPRLVDPASEVGSGKFEEVTGKLETILSEHHKVLIFSSFVKHLKLLEDWCNNKGIRYAMLTGSTHKREKVVNTFKKDKDIKLFLISLKAGGVGLNLAEAGYVFILDPWWNPAAEMQALSRAHRIGQDKNVFVYRFITEGTIEEKIMQLQEKKKKLADTFILSDTTIAGMSTEEVMGLFE